MTNVGGGRKARWTGTAHHSLWPLLPSRSLLGCSPSPCMGDPQFSVTMPLVVIQLVDWLGFIKFGLICHW